ncbi:arfaptin-2 isoform X2 [Parasteatoda tepidariorum]|uniref:Arfaptin-1 n=2 Tax=Parasteatoda tepidariorum TaxID=114398 RepID=A0A2L2YC13_PARTP|nr:arfaptin-2 isoform X2 [Parasteatoda tepidariorum]XP_015908340.1 arfaptin-2 isoform X2 [Parasteatoda tepidariorum]
MSRAANGPSALENVSLDQDMSEVPSLNESQDAVHSGSPSHIPLQRTAIPPSSLPTTSSWQTPLNNAVRSPSPALNGDENKAQVTKPGHSKIDSIKQWSISTYKCTRQILSEKLGKGTRTIDAEMEAQIELLRDTQSKYLNILRLARALTSHFYNVVHTQHSLGEAFSELSHKSPELQEEFLYNADTQRSLSKNGENLLGALKFFVSSLNTLCNKTMDDTLLTVKQYESARLEYDAYRNDLEELMQNNQGNVMSSKVDETKKNYIAHKEKYEKLRADVSIKMKFLEENKVKVMHKQLLLFHNAVSAYFSGNQSLLESTLKQFNVKLKSPNANSPSWLEQ